MRRNIVLDTDAYKLSHPSAYHPDLNKISSYGGARVGGKYPFISFVGLQMIIKDHFLQKVTTDMIDEAEEESFLTFGTRNYFKRNPWERVRDIGYLPIRIKSAPEGTRLAIDNVCFTIESTEDWFAKTANSLEGTLMHTWYPTTVATRSMYIKDAIYPYFKKTSMSPDAAILFAVNDFGYRGATCHEAAARGGLGHLVHFMGSDNMAANRAIKDYYGQKGRLKSVWATEHSVAMSFGDDEKGYLMWQLTHADPKLIASCVIDTRDPDNFIREVAGDPEIIQTIKERPGRTVFRPDTGSPLVNMFKYSDMLSDIYGMSIIRGDYKVLNHNVGLLQGDGMDEVSIPELYRNYTNSGWSADNFVTGSGGGLLQVDANRDTSRWAIKPSYGEKNGVEFNMQKTPKSDMTKKSKSGRLKLHNTSGIYMTISSAEMPGPEFGGYTDSLRTVYENGNFMPDSFENILQRANDG